MSSWRMAGLKQNNTRIFQRKEYTVSIDIKDSKTYVNYSNIAAKTLRKSLKSNFKEEAAKRDVSQVKFYYWLDGTQLAAGEKPKIETEKT